MRHVVASILGRKWVRIILSNLLLVAVGLFTNLISNDISANPQAGLAYHLKSLNTWALVAVVIANTLMQAVLEPTLGFRTNVDFRETLRREVSPELVEAMKTVIKDGTHPFMNADEVKAMLGIDHD